MHPTVVTLDHKQNPKVIDVLLALTTLACVTGPSTTVVSRASLKSRRKKGCVIPTWECLSSDLSDMHVISMNRHTTA